ncbi:unnamed protein product [Auanema sp. JU1783]|nr:unnamed protein product [Auanema sp. JU1783]
MSDNWGCGSDIFGSTKTLSELVDGLSSKKTEITEIDTFPLAPSQADNIGVKVVPFVMSSKSTAPKILKKKSTINKANKEPNLKRVTFEVEKLLAREAGDKEQIRERLVLSLGGIAQKSKPVNYKKFREQRILEKSAKRAEALVIHQLPNQVIHKKKPKKK